jgi:peptidoglycan-associated lipoprotein
MQRGIGRIFGWHSAVLLTGLLVLAGCPKKPSDTATPPMEKVKPPATSTPRADTPAIDEPDLGEEEIVGQNPKVSELGIVYFDYDKSEVRADMKSVLQANARWMITNADVRVQIEGHCDERGTNDYNLALGNRRADAIKRYLVGLGVPSNRLSTISYGEERPVCQRSDDSCWSKNRRGQFARAR